MLTAFFGIVIVHLVALVSPGPAFVMVSRSGLQSKRQGLLVAFGIAIGELVWVSLAVLGLSALVAQVGWLIGLLKIVGGLYLIYLGYKTWVTAKKPLGEQDTPKGNPLLTGALTTLSNPKAIAFFGAILGSFMPADAGWDFKLAVIGVITFNCLL
jgi:threonine efflux protein